MLFRRICFLLYLMSQATPALSQEGFIGVFGDSSGTVECVTVPAFSAKTMYVVAKVAGETQTGVNGAEFQVEFSDPTGYILTYTPPDSCLILGDPLGNSGASLAFYSCRPPTSGIVYLGTIQVVNMGSGGASAITVRKKDPPSNPTHQCALLIKCDAPNYTAVCVTPPASGACLSEKPRENEQTVSTQFTTYIDGGQTSAASSKTYQGYKFVLPPHDWEAAEAKISKPNMPGEQVSDGVKAWVGLDNNNENNNWYSAQAGWVLTAGDSIPLMYFEFRHDPDPVIFQFMGVPDPGSTRYSVERDNDGNIDIFVGSTNVSDNHASAPFEWGRYGPFCGAQFSAEMDNSPTDYTPTCSFTDMRATPKNGSACASLFSPANDLFCPDEITENPLNDAQNGTVTDGVTDSFSTGDTRNQ